MKMKHFLIACLVLAILTIGAVGAADDNLTACDEGDLQQAFPEDDELGDVTVVDKFYVSLEESVAVNYQGDVFQVSEYEDAPEGNLTVNVGESDVPVYNEQFFSIAYLGLADLNISETGTYRIVANFIPADGSPVKIMDKFMNVTGKEGHEKMSGYINEVLVNSEGGESPLVAVELYDDELNGKLLVYLDDELCYNQTVAYGEIYLSDLNRKVAMGKYYVKVWYDDGENVTLLKSRVVTIDYCINVDESDLRIGREAVWGISIPKDATGDLYVTFNGQTSKLDYRDGNAQYVISTDSLQLGKYYNFTVELRNDSIYPYKSYNNVFEACPNLLTPPYQAGVGERQAVLLDMPSGYSGTLSVFNAVEDEFGYHSVGDAIAVANVVNGKAKIELPAYSSQGVRHFFAEYANGNYFHSEPFSMDVEKNRGAISASVTPSAVDVGKSAVLRITGPASGLSFELYVDNAYVKDLTLNNGQASLNIFFAVAGDHFVKVLFCDDGEHDSLAYSNTFKVTVKQKSASPKEVISLALKKVKIKKSAKKLVLKATLKINGKAVKGKIIKFKFKGKTYKAKTNKKGVAKVTIKKKVLKKLKKGKKITYKATYGKVTKKYTVKVKK